MTTPGDAVLTDNPPTAAVLPEAIAEPSSAQLLGRVHAKLSDVETSVAAALHKVETFCGRVLARLEEIAERDAGRVAAAASAIAGVTVPPVSTIAAGIAKVAGIVCECGHDALHTAGGCTAADCTCTSPPPKK
jgi:hypothetical protein